MMNPEYPLNPPPKFNYRPKVPAVKLFHSKESYLDCEEKINTWFLNNPQFDFVDMKLSTTSTPDGTIAITALVMYERQDSDE